MDVLVTAEASQNSGAIYGSQNGGPNTPPTMVNHTMAIMPPCVPGPTTNLNIGMDYWGAGPVAGGMITAGSRESIQSQLWPQVCLFPFGFFLSVVWRAKSV